MQLQFTVRKTLRVQENSCDDVLHYIGTVASLEVVTETWIIPNPVKQTHAYKDTAASNFEGVC